MNQEENSKKDWSPEDLTDLLKTLESNYPGGKEQTERDYKFLLMIAPYMHMTKEEMMEAIPHGYYEMSANGWVVGTGKMGLIMAIQEMQKSIKNSDDETKGN